MTLSFDMGLTPSTEGDGRIFDGSLLVARDGSPPGGLLGMNKFHMRSLLVGLLERAEMGAEVKKSTKFWVVSDHLNRRCM